eukprot:4425935-Pleurochrysis_carterae.AAC.1
MLDSPDSKRRECEGELRRRRDANMTLAGVEGGAETVGRGAVKRASSSSRRAGTVECGEAERTLASATPPVAAAVWNPEDAARRSEVSMVHNASSSANSAA